MKALDLFCGGGGAAMGLHQAGLEVYGVDLQYQPHYPFKFKQWDALDLSPEFIDQFDFIWASPPCQEFSTTKGNGWRSSYPNLIEPTRQLLLESGKPYCIENVPQAPIRCDLMLCGKMFGLEVIRHRHFELEQFQAEQMSDPSHTGIVYTVTGHSGGKEMRRPNAAPRGSAADWRRAMGINWLPLSRLTQAIPPAYSEYIVRGFLNGVNV